MESFSLIKKTEALDALKKEFDGASDRASAVVAGAFLDQLLSEMLQIFFVEDAGNDNKIFKGMGPLATFSAKIDIAYRLGLISEKEHETLHTVRDIRNDFAHKYDDMSFSNQSVKDRCKNIETPIEMLLPTIDLSGEKGLFDLLPGEAVELQKADSNDPRACFQETVVILAWVLVGRVAEAIGLRRAKPVDFTAAHQPAEEMLKIYETEAGAFFRWLRAICHRKKSRSMILYSRHLRSQSE